MSTQVVGIVGTGAIGASIGLRARAAGSRVVGYDADPAQSERARALGALDTVVSRAGCYEQATTLVLAMPVDSILAELHALRTRPPGAELIFDTGSVKIPIVEAAAGLPNFVATHPMAGTAGSGAAAARADLFEHRTWAYVPSGDPVLDARARDFIASLGATPHPIEAAAHDRIVARTSHLPQLCATLFAAQLGEESEDDSWQPLCGPAARELRRLAQSPYGMWESIFRLNAANVAREARLLATELENAAAALTSGDFGVVREAFRRAGAAQNVVVG